MLDKYSQTQLMDELSKQDQLVRDLLKRVDGMRKRSLYMTVFFAASFGFLLARTFYLCM